MNPNGAISRLAGLPPDKCAAAVESIPDEVILSLRWDWRGEMARPSQLPPVGEWQTWLVLAGRGYGKTRVGAEQVREWAHDEPGIRIALVARTAADTRDVMVEGESGLLSVCPPWDRPTYEPSKRLVRWENGSEAHLYSADEPKLLRGPQHHKAWADETASWRRDRETWDMLAFGLRLGKNPQAVITTTPKPTKLIKEISKDPDTSVTRGSTYENAANLAEAFISKIRKRYEGTRLGRQEIYAEILEDVSGAIVSHEMIERARVTEPPELGRIVVAIDPATTSEEESDETGIIAIGRDLEHGHLYVLDDVSLRASPHGWATAAVNLFNALEADKIIAERNAGGDMVEATIRQVSPFVSLDTIHASRGKHIRFEPIGAMYEQGRIHHVGNFPDLENQVCAFTPLGYEGGASPDRADAMVYAASSFLSGVEAACI